MTGRSFDIKARVEQLNEEIVKAAAKANRNPADIDLMAVTKTVDPAIINAAIDAGVKMLGENRVQEFISKADAYQLSNGCEVHFIGHLQTNKVRQIIGRVSMIQSVDRIELAREIDRCAKNNGMVMPVLIEVNIGREEKKFGVLPERLMELVESVALFSNLQLNGLMAIPPFDVTDKVLESYFDTMYRHFIDIRSKKMDNVVMKKLSLGMTQDFRLAIKHNSNIIRIGRGLFGERM